MTALARLAFLAVAGCTACAGVRAADEPTAGASSLAVVGVAVADGTTPQLRRDWTVVVRDGRIAAAGPSASVRAPRGATIVDGAGRYLVPGLWDMHVHLDGRDAAWLPLLVAHGVTAVRDVGTLRAAEGDSVRRLAAARGWSAPRIHAAGFVVETPGSLAFMGRLAALAASTAHPTPRWARGHVAVTAPEGAAAVGDSVARAGGRMLKFIDPGSPAVYDALARAAQAHGVALVGHAPQALRTVGPWRAVDAGQRSFEHLFGWANATDSMPDASRAALAARLRDRNAALVPTLLVSGQDRIPTDRFWDLVSDSLGRVDPRNRWIPPHERSQWAVRLGMLRDPLRPAPSLEALQALQRSYDRETAAVARLHRLGAPVLPGTDLGMYLVYPGSSLHEELALLAREVGMTPFEVLRSATLASARWAGAGDSVGAVRAGQAADLVLLDADPLTDVAHLARIRAVMVGGRLHDRAALDAIVARAVR